MVDSSASKELLEQKMRRIEEVIRKAADVIGQYPPSVNFHDGTCPGDSSSSIAHMHPDTGTICFSIPRVKSLDIETLESTAKHEVSHLLALGHGPDFKGVQALIGIATFIPEHGVVVIDGGGPSTHGVRLPGVPAKENKEHCNYHLCLMPMALTQCKFCKNWFCEVHIMPVLPKMFDKFKPKDMDDRMRADEYKGHPCGLYPEELLKEKEGLKDKYLKALDKLAGKTEPLDVNVSRKDEHSNDAPEGAKEITETYSSEWEDTRSGRGRNLFQREYILPIGIILLGLSIFVFIVVTLNNPQISQSIMPTDTQPTLETLPITTSSLEEVVITPGESDSTTTSTLKIQLRPIVTTICQAVYSGKASVRREVCRNITVWENPQTGKRYSNQYSIVVH